MVGHRGAPPRCPTLTGPGIVVYTDVEGGVLVRATVVVSAEPGDHAGFAVTDLPPL